MARGVKWRWPTPGGVGFALVMVASGAGLEGKVGAGLIAVVMVLFYLMWMALDWGE